MYTHIYILNVYLYIYACIFIHVYIQYDKARIIYVCMYVYGMHICSIAYTMYIHIL